MKQPVSDGAQLNTKPPHLETDQDLLRDQLNYFRASNQLPQLPDSLEQQDEDDHYLSILSRPTNTETPTTSCLEPIKERAVSRSSRRRPRSKHPSPSFPQSTLITHHTPNRFARKSQTPQPPPRDDTNHVSDSSVSEDVRARVESMSIDQIRAAQQEIRDTLAPESIQILKEMWRKSHQTASYPQHSTRSAETVAPTELTPTPKEPRIANQPPQASFPLVDTETSTVEYPFSADARAELLVPAKADESDEEERNKRAWMTDAEEPAPSQNEVDQLIAKALETLGHVGKLRFALDGAALTSEEVRTLPTHLGLHHHGSSPASAGYTLPDILTLMRSTVVSQRVMAMRMLKSIVLRHKNDVVTPLIESGTLTSAFSHLPVDEAFYAATTNQSAYLELVEAFAKDDLLLDEDDSVNNLYFGSKFYSPCPARNYSAVIKALADSDVVATLIAIGRATAAQPEHVSIAERSLRLVRMLVAFVPDAANRVLQNKTSLLALKTLITASTGNHPVLFMLSCDALAQIVVSVGWRGGQVLEQLQEDVIDDRFMENLSSKMIWLLDSDIEEITTDRSLTAKGVLRLVRAALTFQKGIESFAGLAHAVCRLVRDEPNIAEGYLTLEAYSHALFVQTVSHDEEELDSTSNDNVRNAEQHYQMADNLIGRRLSDLIPIAISAVTYFTDVSIHSEESRAAAGHFAATLFALTSNPIVEGYVVRILNVCSSSTKELAQLEEASPNLIQKIRGLASVSHAAARLLSKVKLEEGFIQREVQILISSSTVERKLLEKLSTNSTARIVANACAEWIGLYARVGSAKTTANSTLKLFPYLTDVRVIVDLLSRTLLNVTLLRALYPTISVETAEKCASDLLPLAMTELSSLQQSRSQAERASVCSSFQDLCDLWITKEDVHESVLCIMKAFFETGLLGGTRLFECLLQSPVTRYSDLVFEVLFEVARSCVHQGAPLIASPRKTVLSSLSTTVNSPIVDSVLSLCDVLLSQGPTLRAPAAERVDFLSSILMTLMCGFDIDNTLRVSMWKRTVDDCGGAALYQNAVDLEGDGTSPRSLCLDGILRLFGVSISEGYLDGERCPSVVRNVILARIETALSSDKSADDVFEVLASAVRNRSSLLPRLKKLIEAKPMTNAGTGKLLSGFLDEVRLLS